MEAAEKTAHGRPNGFLKIWFPVLFTLVSTCVCIVAVIVTFVSSFESTNRDEIEKKLLLYSSLIKNNVEERMRRLPDDAIAGNIAAMVSRLSDSKLIDTVYYYIGDDAVTRYDINDGRIANVPSDLPAYLDDLADSGYISWIDGDSGRHVAVAVGAFGPAEDDGLIGIIQMTYRSDSFRDLYMSIIKVVAAAYAVFAFVVILTVLLRNRAAVRKGGADA